ncbi:hypothetical protein GCM10010384_63890 [Streptomyces djakartensis]|uniref:Uncharacterized protein n=1 Tax=Streptomyces djakartensis TaxID=68193 RepID=A0ABQ3AHY9_9ACTN|nr:hypothetical protein GCM10010384_63890 [Streptomyces djakartensis]
MKTEATVPMAKLAFDDPGTRRMFERSRRRALMNLLVRAGGWTALLIVARTVETNAQLIEGAASFLLIPTAFLLAGPARKLRWLRAIETALRSFPWQHCVVAPEQGSQVGAGTAVRVGLGAAGDEHQSASMAARTWRLRRPRAKQLENGAWFAGDLDRGGVIARPGGQVLVSVQRT